MFRKRRASKPYVLTVPARESVRCGLFRVRDRPVVGLWHLSPSCLRLSSTASPRAPGVLVVRRHGELSIRSSSPVSPQPLCPIAVLRFPDALCPLRRRAGLHCCPTVLS